MRLVICDHHRVFADTLGMVLKKKGHQVVACSSTPDDGASAVRIHEPHLFITELEFPHGSSVTAVAAARDSSPRTRIVVLSGSKDNAAGLVAQQAGAHAFLSKRRPLKEILAKLDDVVHGKGSVFDGGPNGNGYRQEPDTRRDPLRYLTVREREVLERLVQGQDTSSLAREMGVTYSTARTHIQNLLCKLGVHSKLEAVALAITLLPAPSPWSERSPLSKVV